MKVLVLLSTYNGEKYLREQIDSILLQRKVNATVFVRDDASTDNTEKILASYDEKIKYYSGKNIGAKASFFDLITKAEDADYYALCDQDDFWLPEKLYSAISHISDCSSPALCFSNMYIVSDRLDILSKSNIRFRPTLGAAMSQNPATGASMVFNRSMLDLIRMTKSFDDISMHDTYIYRIAAATASVIAFDKTPSFLYRQHSSNSIGSRNSFKKFIHYWDFFLRGDFFSRIAEAKQLLNDYDKLIPDENKILLNDIVSYPDSLRAKLKLILGGRLSTGSMLTDMLVDFAIFLNKF